MTRVRLLFIPLFFLAPNLTAQDTISARVSGTVFDSVAMSPLANAFVQLVAVKDAAARSRGAQTDTLGHFSIDSVPVGRYLIGFYHPVLPLLGLDEPTYVLTIAGSQSITADMATPAAATLFALVCGKRPAKDSVGLLLGRLFDARSRTTVRAGSVVVQWPVASIAHGRLEMGIAEVSVAVDTAGRFATCAIPANRDMTLIGESRGDSSGAVPLRVAPRGVAARDLFVGGGERITVEHLDSTFVDSAGVVQPRLTTMHFLRGTARLTGTIRGVRGRPLGAHVSVADAGLEAVTNDLGVYSLANLPAGTHAVSMRAIGFFPDERSIDLVADSAVRLDVRLGTVRAVLDTIRIFGKPISRDLGEFERRRRAGWGSYLTSVEIRRRGAFETTDLIRSARSMFVTRDNRGQLQLYSRGRTCLPAVFIDHVRLTIFDDLSELDSMVLPDEIAAIEFYTASSAPPEFLPFGACAAIVIWRKR